MDSIQVRELGKSYDGVAAVDEISMTIGEGEIFALLGLNGAGKTTTVEMLERRAPPRRRRVRRRIPGRRW